MHASLIGHYKQPEIRLVGDGAGADVVGPDYSQINKADVDEILFHPQNFCDLVAQAPFPE